MTRVVLHIDRLVLRGVARGDAAGLSSELQETLRAELQRRLGGPFRPGLIRALPTAVLRAGSVTAPRGEHGAAVGRALARRLLRGDPP